MGVSMEHWLNKHIAIIQLAGGIVATAITLTAFAYSNFATKEDVKNSISNVQIQNDNVRSWLEKRLDRIEQKQDQLYDKLAK